MWINFTREEIMAIRNEFESRCDFAALLTRATLHR